jgi:hypothetical protein
LLAAVITPLSDQGILPVFLQLKAGGLSLRRFTVTPPPVLMSEQADGMKTAGEPNVGASEVKRAAGVDAQTSKAWPMEIR